MVVNYVEAQGKAFLKEASYLIRAGKAEDVLRHALSAKLPLMFPDQPWWTKAHVTGTESLSKFHELGAKKHGFVDVLVGATVIEYERNLHALGTFAHGLHQVKQYCAGQLNAGTPRDLLVGVLSDTVRWHAFGISDVKELSAVPDATSFGPEHIELVEIESCDLSAAGDVEAKKLGAFLVRHLGREGGRLLAALTLAKDLGFNSPFCQAHVQPIDALVDHAFSHDPTYASLITKLWTDFVSYLGGDAAAGKFDKGSYVGELYILTLAKLICANVLTGRAMISDDSELQAILDGSFFKARGLPNLVEYDYFGWLNASPHVGDLVAVARDIQNDLRAYDFESPPAEDLFGTLMAQLAARSQRLLLGQEWTPSWLAGKLVERVMSALPEDQHPRFVDMCCGSGAIVVETVKRAQQRLRAAGRIPGDPAALSELATAITAFDIDPLAVMLAKVGWVLASKDWLAEGHEAQIPVYHADSLFANTPVTKVFSATGEEQRKLKLDTEEVQLPQFMITASNQTLFDALVSRGYDMAMSSASAASTTLTNQDIETMVDAVLTDTGVALAIDERAASIEFCKKLLTALEKLQRAGRNGIWAFVLRNSFRPALVAGRFNGVVTNPPWLALSKIASNPYQDALKAKSALHGIKAPGSSHLHVEIATIFLLHAIERYLTPGAVIGCILPDTVLNGSHHEPFRSAGYLAAKKPVQFAPGEIWKIANLTFKNEAIVLFGTKSHPGGAKTFVGREVGRTSETATTYHIVKSNGRTAWTTTPPSTPAVKVATKKSIGPLFRQGADVMPRGIVFHAAAKNGAAWNLGPINAGSPFYFLRSDGHRLKDFALTAAGVSDQVMFDVVISKHLAPYELASGAKGLLPFQYGMNGWVPRTGPAIAALGGATSGAINAALTAINESVDEFFETVDTDRKKLSGQGWTGQDWLVFASAGGKLPCAAYVRGDQIPCGKTVIDQTLYWGRVTTEDEAIYITALINSQAIIKVIKAHQPRGAFGERHIHKLAFDRTPAFDSTNPDHQVIVAAAKSLLSQWNIRRTQPDMQPMLLPQKHMITRRTKIRAALEKLPGWEAYQAACATLYGV
jgi:methylase of polypeptide subunit release factors